MASVWQENAQKAPPPLSDRMLRRAAGVARRLHLPGWVFDYSKTLLMQLPQLGSIPSTAAGYHVRPAGVRDIPALTHCRQMDDPIAGTTLFTQRFSKDARCFVVLGSDARPLGYAWAMCTGNLFEDDDRLRVTCRTNGAYIFDTFLHPEARGKGLYPLLIAGLQQELTSQGKTEFHVLVDRGNAVSIRAHLKLGAKICEICTYSTVFGISVYRLQTAQKRKTCLRRYHTDRPCDTLSLCPLNPREFSLSITRIEDEEAFRATFVRLQACEGRNSNTDTPFNTPDIVKVWWKSDIQGREPLFLVEVLHPRLGGGAQAAAYGFFRLHEDKARFLQPRELIAFDDVQFMSNTLLVRSANLRAIDIHQILSLQANLRRIQQATGADVVIWHRLPPGELSLCTTSLGSRWNTLYETVYPMLDATSAHTPLESTEGIHALHDLAKQAKRLRNAYQSEPETVCESLGSLDETQRQLVLAELQNLLDASWQHEWMERSDQVDYGIFVKKLMAYTEVWSMHDCVRLYITKVAGTDMAYLYTLQLGNTCWCIMTGYNPNYKSYSPGKTVFAEMLRQTWESGIREYHLGGNVLGWKEPWATRTVHLHTLELWLNTTKARTHRIKLVVRYQSH